MRASTGASTLATKVVSSRQSCMLICMHVEIVPEIMVKTKTKMKSRKYCMYELYVCMYYQSLDGLVGVCDDAHQLRDQRTDVFVRYHSYR